MLGDSSLGKAVSGTVGVPVNSRELGPIAKASDTNRPSVGMSRHPDERLGRLVINGGEQEVENPSQGAVWRRGPRDAPPHGFNHRMAVDAEG